MGFWAFLILAHVGVRVTLDWAMLPMVVYLALAGWERPQ